MLIFVTSFVTIQDRIYMLGQVNDSGTVWIEHCLAGKGLIALISYYLSHSYSI